MSVRNPNGLRIAFMHPDLGIGGAERLVVDAALALRRYGHLVHMFTSHHDPLHCFEETTGPNGIPVIVAGNWLPRTFLGKFAIVFAMLRGIWLSLYVLFNWTEHNPLIRFGNPSHVENQKLIGMLMRFVSHLAPICDPVFPSFAISPPAIYFISHSQHNYPLGYFIACYIIPYKGEYDIVITDQLSIYNLFLLFTTSRTVFYCHYPDLLLSKPESNPILNILKGLYRLPINTLEQVSTGVAETILVNSKFTQKTFANTFNVLNTMGIQPGVLYPSINMDSYDNNQVFDEKVQHWWKWRYNNPTIDLTNSDECTKANMPIIWNGEGQTEEEIAQTKPIYDIPTETCLFVSINRYEIKKAVEQGIYGFVQVKDYINKRRGDEQPINTETHLRFKDAKLVIGGGYDPLVPENLQYYTQLAQITKDNGLVPTDYPDTSGDVIFLRSFSQAQRTALLRRAQAILYTPKNEHFGIVPVEAMYSSRSVIAHASGGPLESVLHWMTGFLCHHDDPITKKPEQPTPTIPLSSRPPVPASSNDKTELVPDMPTPSFGEAMLTVFHDKKNLHFCINRLSNKHAIANFSIQVFDKSWNDIVVKTAAMPIHTTHWFKKFAINFGTSPMVRVAFMLNIIITVILVMVYTWNHRGPVQ